MLIFNSSFALLPSFFLPSTTKFHPTPKDRMNHRQHVTGRHDSWILGWKWRTRDADVSRVLGTFFIYFIYFLFWFSLQVNYFYGDHNDNQQQQLHHHHPAAAATTTASPPATPAGVVPAAAITAGAGPADVATTAAAATPSAAAITATAVEARGSRRSWVFLFY